MNELGIQEASSQDFRGQAHFTVELAHIFNMWVMCMYVFLRCSVGAAPRHGWIPDTCSSFHLWLQLLKMSAARGPCEVRLLKPWAPLRPSLPLLLSFWSKRRGRHETYYSLYGLCLGVRLPCCLGPQKRAAPAKRPLYGHHSTRLKPPSRRQRGRGVEMET